MSSDVNKTLDERGERYGKFSNHADLSQKLKQAMKEKATWWDLSPSQQESLEMIAHKIARILNGDPNYADKLVSVIQKIKGAGEQTVKAYSHDLKDIF